MEGMNQLIIGAAIAIITAAAAVLFRELFEYLRRPKLKIDFEEYEGQKPYILDLFLESETKIAGLTNKAKFLRLDVHNAGRKPAMDCEAKMVIFKTGKRESFTPSVHWTRRDPAVYKTLDQIYAPMHLNRGDHEPVDLFMLPYHPEEPELGPGACIQSMSPRVFRFERDTAYHIKVTVYASNTISQPFTLKLYWDGTLEGFDKAFQKVGKDENAKT
jgi:hypothetical protein